MWQEDKLHGDLLSDKPKLGLGLTSTWPPDELVKPPLSDVEKDKNLNATFALSGKQLGLLKGGTVKNRSTTNDKVLEKRDKLPERIRHLIQDIALLQYGSFLSESQWSDGAVPEEERLGSHSNLYQVLLGTDPESMDYTAGGTDGTKAEEEEEEEVIEKNGDDESDRYVSRFEAPAELWEGLLDIPHLMEFVREDVFFHGNPVFSKETKLGYDIGNLLRMLRPEAYDSYFDRRWEFDDRLSGAGLMWGFTLAFIGQSKTELVEEQRQLNELFSLFNELHQARKEEAERMPTMDEIQNAQFEEVTKEALQELGFSTPLLLLREVEYHRDRNEHSFDDVETKRIYTKKIIREIAEKTPLEKVEELTETLKDDLEVIDEQGASGIESVRVVLDPVWEFHTDGEADADDGGLGLDKPTSEWIANTEGLKKSPVSTVLNRVSNDSGSELWTTEELLIRTEGSERGVKWSLTNYGALLSYTRFEKEGELDWIYHLAIGPEELSMYERKLIMDALDELGTIKPSS